MDTAKIISIILAFFLLFASIVITSSIATVNRIKESYSYIVVGKYLRFPTRPETVVYEVKNSYGVEGTYSDISWKVNIELGDTIIKRMDDVYLYVNSVEGKKIKAKAIKCIESWERDDWAWPTAWKNKWPEASCNENNTKSYNYLGWICFGFIVYQLFTWWEEREK